MRFLELGIGGLSHQSCMSLHIGTNNIVPEGLEEIATGDTVIKRSRTVKYIGLHIDELLNWKAHIAYLNILD